MLTLDTYRATPILGRIIIILFAFLLTLVLIYNHSSIVQQGDSEKLNNLLKSHDLWQYRNVIHESNCKSLVCLVKFLEKESCLPELLNLKNGVLQIQKQLILNRWLTQHNLHNAEEKFFFLGIRRIEELIIVDDAALEAKLGSIEAYKFILARQGLPQTQADFDNLSKELWAKIEAEAYVPWTTVGQITVALIVSLAAGMGLKMNLQLQGPCPNNASPKLGILSYVTGRYLSPFKCRVDFHWDDQQVVGETMSFVVNFYQRNGKSYPISNEDNVLIEVTQESNKVACSIELGGPEVSDANKARVQFSVRRAGDYTISVLIGMTHIQGSPFTKVFLPGIPDPLKTSFIHHCSLVVGSEDIPTQLFIEPRDQYGNHCVVKSGSDPANEYGIDIIEVNTGRPIAEYVHWETYPLISRLALILKFPKEGCYHITVSHKGHTIQNGDFHVIILNKDEAISVQKNVAKKNKCYEVKLLTLKGEKYPKPKKVYCYISPKQLTLKEYMWKFFPKHLVTFRLCPSTKFKFQSGKNHSQKEPTLLIDDGCQQEVELFSSDVNIIAATFTQFLLKNIGGSETFKDKQDFFYHEVRKYHHKHLHEKISLKITRAAILESSLKETRLFGISDWCKNFELSFIGEEGLDWGGIRREWFEFVCLSLFAPENLFFCSFNNDKQSLVHPCPTYKRPPSLKLKYYEFAGKIVGKCLYESALGSSYRQLVKAKFTRSFLAQLIGLSVHYKYFEHDDPDLYVSKIKFILENDIESMGLYFTEELYDSGGHLLEEVDLISNGSNVLVTNENKIQYLNALAQHRLATSVKPEIEHFLKGLTELIPDNLLCIFDENELELLMCGTGSYSIADFKTNHATSSSSYEFKKVLDWFWITVSNFSEEEMARLLQFTTGCSQLPPGGFSELNPKFQITSAPTRGNLPTAHTCFNQLCLPDYDSYEQFEKSLRLAINEGSEGFGMV